MGTRSTIVRVLSVFFAVLLIGPQGFSAQSEGEDKPFKQEELEQMLAPIALYPDSLLAQIFMASTYPLEVVQARRWVKANQKLEGEALTKALEKENWDPSVKSLVNFPQVLDMMNEKLDWTQKLGDAFLAQQKDVMDTVQKLRAKAKAEGNLKSTEEQKVIVEKGTETIVIESSNPQVVYVPAYNPTAVYGAWPYPAYPPYYYYPPGYAAGTALFSIGMGVAVGAAWGYAWGHCGWGHGEVDIDVNRNTNINTNIDRSKYQNKVTSGQGGRGSWQHNPEHRKGVSYRDQASAQRFDRAPSSDVQSRETFRGRAETGRQDLQGRGATGSLERGAAQQSRGDGSGELAAAQQRSSRNAFSGYEKGSQTGNFSARGHQSMSSSRAGGFGGGMSRGGGRGGGGRR